VLCQTVNAGYTDKFVWDHPVRFCGTPPILV